ncbi:MAG: YceH family protein [Thermoanaerobaculia bacterium]
MIFSRPLDPSELRVLGSLIEKQLTTPEYYPLTFNALTAACNQKTNREPVMELSERDLKDALIELQNMKLVWEVLGGRVARWDQNLDKALGLDTQTKAILGLLLLRGPQTPGELRGRSERLAAFQSVQDVEDVLRRMASAATPLVQELPRRPGQKETRWTQLLGDVAPAEDAGEPRAIPQPAESLGARLERLEARLEAIEAQLGKLLG